MPKRVMRPCAYCDGKGEVREGEYVKTPRRCPVCNGNGQNSVGSDYVRCRLCNGSGKKDIGVYVPKVARCDNCKGTGWAPLREY